MPMINMDEAVSLDHLMQKAIRTKLGLPEKYAYRVFAAYNVTSMVAAMHKCGHYIVDLKPSNVSVYKDTMMVAMVDCDGFQLKAKTITVIRQNSSVKNIFIRKAWTSAVTKWAKNRTNLRWR